MKQERKQWIWIVLNLLWWLASITLGYTAIAIDTNPLLSNNGEIILNGLIWVLGHGIIWLTSADEDENGD